MKKLLSFLLILVAAASSPVYAELKAIKLVLPSSLVSNSEAARLLAVAEDGSVKTTDISNSARLSIRPTASKVRLFILNSSSQVSYQVVNRFCKKGSDHPHYKTCSGKSKVVTTFKAGANIGKLTAKGQALLASLKKNAYSKAIGNAKGIEAEDFVPTGLASHGLASSISTQKTPIIVKSSKAGTDDDKDGLPNSLDVDDDGDGILDNYEDSSPSSSGSVSKSFNIFSNLKLDIESSLNFHTTGLDTSRIDTALSNVQTLAIEVAGNPTDTVELNCTGLGYCKSGGTGKEAQTRNDFPGISGGTYDSDGDGLGLVTNGPTGDFQLLTGANSSTIAAGDTLIEEVTDSTSATVNISSILNFVFHSTPAVKEVTIDATTTAVDYSVTPIAGSRTNCFTAPATGDVSVTITGWRPQRPGDSSIGEAAYVDLGNSLVVVDIPNAPCTSPSSGCSGTGPGNCVVSAYASSDPNLTVGTSSLEDGKKDVDADITNTYTFTVNLSTCLNNASSGPISWNAGDALFVDLQFRSTYGDNAAQKFCVKRGV